VQENDDARRPLPINAKRQWHRERTALALESIAHQAVDDAERKAASASRRQRLGLDLARCSRYGATQCLAASAQASVDLAGDGVVGHPRWRRPRPARPERPRRDRTMDTSDPGNSATELAETQFDKLTDLSLRIHGCNPNRRCCRPRPGP